MRNKSIITLKQVQFFLACVCFASSPQHAAGGSLLSQIDDYLNGNYPVATAYLDLYDASGASVGRQQVDATGLLSVGYVNTGTELSFNGSLSFPSPYPLTAGNSGGLLASVHDFSVDLSTAINSSNTDLITMQIDWLNNNQTVSETWGLTVADDFVNGIAYYIYYGNSPQALSYGSASFSLEFATGVASVPLPASAVLFSSGLLGLFGIASCRKAA